MINTVYRIQNLGLNLKRKRICKKTIKKKAVPLPYFIAWDCTRKCNLRCKHCGAAKEAYEKELSTGEIKKVIDDLSIVKKCFFGATGGEPMLRKDLLEVIKYAKSKGMDTGFASNGFSIDKERAWEIKDAGVKYVQISIDGPEEIHNNIRGNKESFSRAVKAILNLQRAGIPEIRVATTVTKDNIDKLTQIRDFLINLDVKIWRLVIIMPVGRAKNPREFLLSSDEMNRLLDFVAKNKEKIFIYIGESLPYLGKYEEIIRDTPLKCPVGIGAFCVGVTGNIRGCPEQPDTSEFIEGNIKKSSILKIWQRGFKKYRLSQKNIVDEKCNKCKKFNFCFGGCWVMRIKNLHCIYDLLK